GRAVQPEERGCAREWPRPRPRVRRARPQRLWPEGEQHYRRDPDPAQRLQAAEAPPRLRARDTGQKSGKRPEQIQQECRIWPVISARSASWQEGKVLTFS